MSDTSLAKLAQPNDNIAIDTKLRLTDTGWIIASDASDEDLMTFSGYASTLASRAESLRAAIIQFAYDNRGREFAEALMEHNGWYSGANRGQTISDLSGTRAARAEAHRYGIVLGPSIVRVLAPLRDDPARQVEIVRGMAEGTVPHSVAAVMAEVRGTDQATEAANALLVRIQRDFDALKNIGTLKQVKAVQEYILRHRK